MKENEDGYMDWILIHTPEHSHPKQATSEFDFKNTHVFPDDSYYLYRQTEDSILRQFENLHLHFRVTKIGRITATMFGTINKIDRIVQ